MKRLRKGCFALRGQVKSLAEMLGEEYDARPLPNNEQELRDEVIALSDEYVNLATKTALLDPLSETSKQTAILMSDIAKTLRYLDR